MSGVKRCKEILGLHLEKASYRPSLHPLLPSMLPENAIQAFFVVIPDYVISYNNVAESPATFIMQHHE